MLQKRFHISCNTLHRGQETNRHCYLFIAATSTYSPTVQHHSERTSTGFLTHAARMKNIISLEGL